MRGRRRERRREPPTQTERGRYQRERACLLFSSLLSSSSFFAAFNALMIVFHFIDYSASARPPVRPSFRLPSPREPASQTVSPSKRPITNSESMRECERP